MDTIKISELPQSESFEGLFTLGVDAGNRSVKVSLDELKENAAVLEAAREILARMEEFDGRVRPTALSAPAVWNVPVGGESMIPVTLSPEGAMHNVIYQTDGSSVKVYPDGRAEGIEAGTSAVYVIPTENTSLFKKVKVSAYGQHLVLAGDVMRVTSDNVIRLT